MKQTLLLTLLFLASISAKAQKIEIGGEIGLNFSQMEYNGRTSDRTGNLAALFIADFLISDNFSLAGKIGYIGKGGGDNLDESNTNFDANFGYLSLYVSPRLYFLNRNKIHPYFHFSPSLSYLLSGNVNGTDVKNDAEQLDFALQGGIGLKFDLSQNLIMDLNAGFEQGFSRVISVFPNQLHNRSFPYIGVGIRYVIE
ncbi:outer membrane beta-barrel protein [Maribacter sp. 2210JD10-5]|uniref:outer membrane beta-barrel protein n=1 Tax=Maribacter sp. 2210JD10-5 TaxID=3386272 RepID=UPI0039BC87C0